MRIKLKAIPTSIAILFSFLSYLQTANIKGKIVNEELHPLIGANVYLKGTILGSTTNLNGEFLIEKIPKGKYVVTISVIGYEQKEIPVTVVKDYHYDLGTVKLKPSPLQGEPVVVTASKHKQNLQDVPVSISTLGRKEIELRNIITLDKALQYISGVNLNSSQVNIRGSSGYSRGVGSRVLFLLDGVPFLTGDTREINFETIPVYLIDHVEVLKGAGSALYGSSALGGVVNIITRGIEPGTHFYFKIYGGIYSEPSFSQWKWTEKNRFLNGSSVLFSQKIKNLGVMLGGSRDQDDGYRQNDWFQRHSVNGSLQWDISPFQHLTISGNFITKKRGNFLYWQDLNHALQPPLEQRDDRVETQRYYLSGNYRYILNKNRYLTIRGIWYHNHFEDNVSKGSGNISTSKNLNTEIQFNSQIGSIFLTTGLEGTWNSATSNIFGNRNGYGSAAYIQGEWELSKRLKGNFGVRFDYFTLDSVKSDYRFNPKVGIVFKPFSGGALRSSIGFGFRAPSIAEAFTSTSAGGFRVVPNTNLRAEKSFSFEIGWNQILTPWIATDLATFYNRYADLIEGTFQKSLQVQFQNITKARIQGIELNLNGGIWNKKIQYRLGYTYVDPRDLENDQFLIFRPRHLLQSNLQFNFYIFHLGLDYRYISKYDRIDERLALLIPDAEKRVPVHVVDVQFLTNFRLGQLPCSTSLQINNLLRYNYVDLVGALAPLRHFILTFQAGM